MRSCVRTAKNVGLPDGQMGNSEVGHLNIGAGRVVYQDLVKIKNNEKIAFYLISLLLSLYYVYFADTNTFHYFTIKIITR